MKTPKCPFIPNSLMVSHSQSLTVSHSPPISHFLISFPLTLSITDGLTLTLTHSPSPAHHPSHHRRIFTAVSPHLLLLYSSPPSSTQTPCHHRTAPSRNTTIALRHRRCTTTANAWRHHRQRNTGSSLFLLFKNTPKLLFLCFVFCSYFAHVLLFIIFYFLIPLMF